MNPSNESLDPEPRPEWCADSRSRGLLAARPCDNESDPVATSAEAQRLLSERPPDAALVDINLRGGERADGLIARLHELGIYVIVTTGYTEVTNLRQHAVTILHKPVSETALLGSLRPIVGRKTQRRVGREGASIAGRTHET
jgi:DNA-binding NtrC family response regulator